MHFCNISIKSSYLEVLQGKDKYFNNVYKNRYISCSKKNILPELTANIIIF